MADENFNLILEGLSKGDQIGGPTQLAKILCESIKSCKSFDKDDLTKRYLKWWENDAFDTGPTYASVFSKIVMGTDPDEAVRQTHKEFNLNTAGCGPAHRCAPLAGFMNIPSTQLISIAHQEASITHHHPDAGNGSALVVMICRLLLEGLSFQETLENISTQPELKTTLFRVNQAQLRPDGYVLNVLHSAFYFIKKLTPMETVFKFAGKPNYCPVIVGSIRACINQKLKINH